MTMRSLRLVSVSSFIQCCNGRKCSRSSSDSSAPPSPSSSHVNLGSPRLHAHADRKHATSLIKSALLPLLSLLPSIRSRSRVRNPEGLIAPRSPSKSSPLPSPALQAPNYYPWGTEEKPVSSPGFITPHRSMTPLGGPKTPPPPRRTQSELQITTRGNSHSGPRAEEGMRKVSVGRRQDWRHRQIWRPPPEARQNYPREKRTEWKSFMVQKSI